MLSMHTRRGVRGAMAGLLLVGAAMASVCGASPMGPEVPSARDAARLEGALPNELDRRLIGEVAQEVRRTGPGVTPSVLGIDDAFLDAGSFVHQQHLRDQLREPQREDISNRGPSPARPNAARNVDPGTDIFKDAMNSALKATREAFFEGGDTAYFSLAGIDLTVTLKGDRRGISINSYELLASNQYGGQGSDVLAEATAGTAERTPGSASSESQVRQYTPHTGDTLSLADIRRFFYEPMTIAALLVVFGVWVVFTMASSRARG